MESPPHMVQVLNIPSTIFHLKLDGVLGDSCRLGGMDDDEWLHFLNQFSEAQALYVVRKFAGRVALALESITAEMVGEVLPCLDLTCLVDQ